MLCLNNLTQPIGKDATVLITAKMLPTPRMKITRVFELNISCISTVVISLWTELFWKARGNTKETQFILRTWIHAVFEGDRMHFFWSLKQSWIFKSFYRWFTRAGYQQIPLGKGGWPALWVAWQKWAQCWPNEVFLRITFYIHVTIFFFNITKAFGVNISCSLHAWAGLDVHIF